MSWRYDKAHVRSRNRLYQGDSLVASTEQQFDQRSVFRSDETQVGAVIEYHRPVGMRWQADVISQANFSRRLQAIFGTSQAQVAYVMADRWLAAVNAVQSVFESGLDDSGTVPAWQVTYNAALGYWLEDSWSIDLSVGGVQQHDASRFERDYAFTLGFTYRIAGLLNAPGVFEPQRLAPPSN